MSLLQLRPTPPIPRRPRRRRGRPINGGIPSIINQLEGLSAQHQMRKVIPYFNVLVSVFAEEIVPFVAPGLEVCVLVCGGTVGDALEEAVEF
jgi:hypothetical protein